MYAVFPARLSRLLQISGQLDKSVSAHSATSGFQRGSRDLQEGPPSPERADIGSVELRFAELFRRFWSGSAVPERPPPESLLQLLDPKPGDNLLGCEACASLYAASFAATGASLLSLSRVPGSNWEFDGALLMAEELLKRPAIGDPRSASGVLPLRAGGVLTILGELQGGAELRLGDRFQLLRSGSFGATTYRQWSMTSGS